MSFLQYPHQAQYPPQAQYLHQAQYPPQAQYLHQAQYPHQACCCHPPHPQFQQSSFPQQFPPPSFPVTPVATCGHCPGHGYPPNPQHEPVYFLQESPPPSSLVATCAPSSPCNGGCSVQHQAYTLVVVQCQSQPEHDNEKAVKKYKGKKSVIKHVGLMTARKLLPSGLRKRLDKKLS